MDRREFLHTSTGFLAMAAMSARLRAQAAAPGPIVDTHTGKIRGVIEDGVRTFRGIPYGASTDGAARFQAPKPPTPWTGVRDVSQFGPRFYQPFRPMIPEIGDALTGTGPMSEDALRVNVWTPSTTGKRPVMVWFHGGGQRTGSGNSPYYDGHALARRHDVVVVTTTHRLNAFAYLWLAGLPATGERFADTTNLGLRDLVLALEWVRDHIARFGGDPNNVTIFGQSGGGGKTAMLTGFPAAKGLFHKAIIMATLEDTAITGLKPAQSAQNAELLLRRLGVAPADAAKLLTMPAEQIVEALLKPGPATGAGTPQGDISLRFVPVVDGKTLLADPYEPASPLSADIPVLTGSNETEGIPYGNPDDPYWTSEPQNDAELRKRVMQVLPMSEGDADRLIARYKASRPKADAAEIAAVMAGDASALRAAGHVIAERKFALKRAPVYLYQFNWRSPVRNGKLRSMHGMELPFVFDHVDLQGFMTGTGRDRYALATQVSNAWVAFAKTGNPNHSGIPKWSPFNPTDRPTMVFDRETRAVNDPHGDIRQEIARLRAARNTA